MLSCGKCFWRSLSFTALRNTVSIPPLGKRESGGTTIFFPEVVLWEFLFALSWNPCLIILINTSSSPVVIGYGFCWDPEGAWCRSDRVRPGHLCWCRPTDEHPALRGRALGTPYSRSGIFRYFMIFYSRHITLYLHWITLNHMCFLITMVGITIWSILYSIYVNVNCRMFLLS